MTAEPVWQWPPGMSSPVLVGRLSVAKGAPGIFQYDAEYVASGGLALDPDQLDSVRRRQHAVPADSREGIPGLIADAGPDTWGRRTLALALGHEPDPLEALCLAPDDGAGNLAVGDLSRKHPVRNLDLQVLSDLIERQLSGQPVKDRQVLDMISPDTALGGAKPKASVFDQDGHWIAKFTERGEPWDLPFYEAAALRMCARLGIPAAEVKVHRLSEERSVFLVKRFDRTKQAGGQYVRHAMASALTVLGAKAQTFSAARTYMAYISRLKRWVPDIEPVKREIWQRIVFTALVGNNDDHPRNHTVLKGEHGWGLSQVFDVVPTWIHRDRLSLAMPYLQLEQGALSALVTGSYLVQAAPKFGWTLDAAQSEIIRMAEQIADEWPVVLRELEAPTRVTDGTQPALNWAARLLAEVRAVDLHNLTKVSKPKRQSWSWTP